MGSVLKWVIVALVVVLVLSADVLLVMKMEWPWWMFLAVLLSVIAAILAVIFAVRGIRSLLQKRADQKAAAAASGSDAQRREIQDRWRQMQSTWNATIKLLRKAKLRTKGDPVKTAPWYLLIGAPGSGKTAAIKNSRHAMHFSEVISGFRSSTPDDSGDWYFVDDAIVIDTPGYLVAHRSPSDGQAWNKLLHLIKRTRSLPALNGVIVCLAADDLLGGNLQRLQEIGTNLRQRMTEVMRVLGVRCPVYVMVTRCDHILGMMRFFQSFPDATFNQALGALNAHAADGVSPAKFVETAFEQLRDDLSRLRMVVLGSKYAPEVEAQALLFPEEFFALKNAVATVLRAAFDAGQQADTPFLRGLYFSSARQEGVPASSYMERLGFGAERQALAPANLSLFLRDFFGRILLQDRNLVAPTRTAVVLARFTQNAGLAAWAIAMLVVGILLTVSFVHNLSLTRTAFGNLPSATKITKDFSADLTTLSGFRTALDQLVKDNASGWLPRLGLRQSLHAQEQLQTVYAARFRSALLEPMDQTLDASLQRLSAASPPEQTAAVVDLIAKRIKLLQGALNGELADAEPGVYLPPNFSALSNAYSALNATENVRALGADYASYVAWQSDPRVLEQELAQNTQRIRTVLTREGIGLHWITAWANLQDTLPAISGRDYWGPELDSAKSIPPLSVGKAFTPEGWNAVRTFLGEIEAANQGDEVFLTRRKEYEASYRVQYFKAWQDFLLAFYHGGEAFTSREQRMQLATRLANKDSPYRRVIDTAEAALLPPMELAEKPEHIPEWVHVLNRYQQLNDPEYQKQLGGAPGVLDKLAGKGGKVVKKLKFAVKGDGDATKQLENDQKALTHLLSYQETMKKSVENAQAPAAALQLAKDVYLEAGSVIGEPKQIVTHNFWDQTKLKEYLGRGAPAEEVFWQILARPMEQIWSVLLHEAGGQMQKQWASDVVAQGNGLSGWELVDALQGFGGKAWEFQKSTLDPFLRNTPGKGYEPRVLFNSFVGFSPGLMHLLNRGRVGKDALAKPYAVQISAFPTDANADAVKKPHETRLIVQCGAGNQELVNHNFPIKKTIQWTPQGCTDVIIEVYVGDAILKQIYSGYRAFFHFLSDFSSGRKVLRAADFPEQAGVLSGYKVRTVTLAYGFSGHDGVLRLAGADPSAVPERIIAAGD